jgi:hypothetical protein
MKILKPLIKLLKYFLNPLLKPTELIDRYPTNVTLDYRISMVKYHWGEIEHYILSIAKIKWKLFLKYGWKYFVLKTSKIIVLLTIGFFLVFFIYKAAKPKIINIYHTDSFESKIEKDSIIIIRDVVNPQLKKYFDYIAATEVPIKNGDTLSSYQVRCYDSTSSAIGRYQMVNAARTQIGLGGVSDQVFLNNPELQDVAMYLLIKDNYRAMKPFIDEYDGKIINGYFLTEPGMLSLAHALGASGAMTWIKNGCKVNQLPSGAPNADRRLTFQKYKIKFK